MRTGESNVDEKVMPSQLAEARTVSDYRADSIPCPMLLNQLGEDIVDISRSGVILIPPARRCPSARLALICQLP